MKDVDLTRDFDKTLWDITEDQYQLLLAKNRNYGDNLLYFGLRGVIMRLHDKYKRLETLCMRGEADEVNESITDTLRDLSGYSLVALAHLRMGDMTLDGTWQTVSQDVPESPTANFTADGYSPVLHVWELRS